jgi:hypothetical protein
VSKNLKYFQNILNILICPIILKTFKFRKDDQKIFPKILYMYPRKFEYIPKILKMRKIFDTSKNILKISNFENGQNIWKMYTKILTIYPIILKKCPK